MPPLPRAHALFYDDTAENFRGATPSGPHPNVVCARLQKPLSTEQLAAAHNLFESRTDPMPFFFFDFDGTLSMADGLLQDKGGSLQQLFGGTERRRALQLVVGKILAKKQCYVLTANPWHGRVTEALNALLSSGGGGIPTSGGAAAPLFTVDDTVRYTPAGTKLKEIEAIIASRGYRLVGPKAR